MVSNWANQLEMALLRQRRIEQMIREDLIYQDNARRGYTQKLYFASEGWPVSMALSARTALAERVLARWRKEVALAAPSQP